MRRRPPPEKKRDQLSIHINNNCSNSNISINIVSPGSAAAVTAVTRAEAVVDTQEEKIGSLSELDSKLSIEQVIRAEPKNMVTKRDPPRLKLLELPAVAVVWVGEGFRRVRSKPWRIRRRARTSIAEHQGRR